MVYLSLKKIISSIREYWEKDKVNFIGWIIAIIGFAYFIYWYLFVYIPSLETWWWFNG